MSSQRQSFPGRGIETPARKAEGGSFLRRVSVRLAGLARAEGGAAAIYVALVLPAFVGAGGLAVDVASWYSSKRTMQSGADAAAYAAALELARQGLDQAPDLPAMQAAADDAAGRNGVGTSVTVRTPPWFGPAAGDPQSVEVIVTEPAPLYFTGLFLGAAPDITTRATAKAVVSDACVWSLHPSAPSAVHVAGTADVDLDCGDGGGLRWRAGATEPGCLLRRDRGSSQPGGDLRAWSVRPERRRVQHRRQRGRQQHRERRGWDHLLPDGQRYRLRHPHVRVRGQYHADPDDHGTACQRAVLPGPQRAGQYCVLHEAEG